MIEYKIADAADLIEAHDKYGLILDDMGWPPIAAFKDGSMVGVLVPKTAHGEALDYVLLGTIFANSSIIAFGLFNYLEQVLKSFGAPGYILHINLRENDKLSSLFEHLIEKFKDLIIDRIDNHVWLARRF